MVGAGVSIHATGGQPVVDVPGLEHQPSIMSWPGLLYHGVSFCESWTAPRKGWADLARKEVGFGDLSSLMSVGTKIENQLGAPRGGMYRRWLSESVGQLSAADRSVIKALHDLENPLATTNYDGLIEEVSGLAPVTWRDGSKLERVLRGDAAGVIHFHGHWDDPESVVLGYRSYESVIRDLNAQAQLRAVFATRAVLLVGFGAGLDDPNLGPLISWLREAFRESVMPRFRLKLEQEPGDARAEYPILPIDYGSSHADLAIFLQSLRQPAHAKGVSLQRPIRPPDEIGTHDPFAIHLPPRSVFPSSEFALFHFDVGSYSPVGVCPPSDFIDQDQTNELRTTAETRFLMEYCYVFKSKYPDGIFWLSGGRPLDQEIASIAEQIGIEAASVSPEGKIQSVFRFLRTRSKSLLVIEDLTEAETLYRPVASGCIPASLPCGLAFSSRRLTSGRYLHWEVELLPEEDALRLLLRYPRLSAALDPTHASHEDARAIVRMLGYYNRAILLAGAHLGARSDPGDRGHASLSGFRERLSKDARYAAFDRSVLKVTHEALSELRDTAIRTMFDELFANLDEEARRVLRVAFPCHKKMYISRLALGLLAAIDIPGENAEGSGRLAMIIARLMEDGLLESSQYGNLRVPRCFSEVFEELAQSPDAIGFRTAASRRVAAAFGTYATLEWFARQNPGIYPLEQAIYTALVVCPQEAEPVRSRLGDLLRLLRLESHNLRDWDPVKDPAYFPQQIRNRAYSLGLVSLLKGAEARLAELRRPHALTVWSTHKASPALVRTLVGHFGPITAVLVEWGEWIISGSDDGTVNIWDYHGGFLLRTLRAHDGGVNAIAFARRHLLISAGGDRTIKIWDVESGELLHTLSGFDSEVSALAVSEDNRLVSGCEDGTLRIWELWSENAPRVIPAHSGRVNRLELTRDGRVVSKSGKWLEEGPIKVFDLDSGLELASIDNQVHASAFSLAYDARIVSYSRGALHTIDIESGAPLGKIETHRHYISALSYTGENRVVSGSYRGVLREWDIESRTHVNAVQGQGALISCLSESLLGTIVAGDHASRLSIWDLSVAEGGKRTSGEDPEPLNAVLLLENHKVVAGGNSELLRFWDSEDGRVKDTSNLSSDRSTYAQRNGEFRAFARAADGALVSADGDGAVTVWNLRQPEKSRRIAVKEFFRVNGLRVTSSQRVVCAGWGREKSAPIAVWDLTTGSLLLDMGEPGAHCHAMAGDQKIVAQLDNELTLWDVETGEELTRFANPGARSLDVSPDGKVVSGHNDGTIRTWDLEKRRELSCMKGHSGSVKLLAISRDGCLASGSRDYSIRLWDLGTASLRAVVPLDAEPSCLVLDEETPTLFVGDRGGGLTCLELFGVNREEES
jgi:WD40 repeat protein